MINRNANPYKYYYHTINLDLTEVISLTNVKFDERKFIQFINKIKLEFSGNHDFILAAPNSWEYHHNNFFIENLNYNMEDIGFSFEGEQNEYNKISVIISKEEIENLNNRSNFDIQHDSQLFFNSNNNVVSRAKSKVNVISFSTYLLNTEFVNRAIAISLDDYEKAPEGENTSFVITKEYKKGNLKGTRIYKLASVSEESSISEFPLINITLTI